ncbi:MAG: LssY C-terminal domain-containing protein [Pirellulaceae bacterium]
MDESEVESPSPPDSAARRNLRWQLARLTFMAVVAYLISAYILLPLFWKFYVRRHPSLDEVPGITTTRSGIPGDPLNVGLIGTEEELKFIMAAASWHSADSLSLRSDLRITEDTVLDRSYDQAPVSSLYLFGRKEDLAFEMPVGENPRKRHHVRFWKSDKTDPDGRPVWLGSATYDERVGLSHTTAEVTHHIAPDVDTERDHLVACWKRTELLSELYYVEDYHEVCTGKNGGGDPWHTDGRLAMGVVAARE